MLNSVLREQDNQEPMNTEHESQSIPSLAELGVPITATIPSGPADILPGLLPRMGELVISGETEIGKSLLALEICSSLVTGAPLWGTITPTIQAKRIMYVLGEHYIEILQRLALKTMLPMSENIVLLGPEQLKGDKWLVSAGRLNTQSVQKFERWAEGVDLIVFDPLSAFTCGVDTENDNIQMRLVLQTMSDIAHAAGASCLVIAHCGKPQMDMKGIEHQRRSYAIRGASSIEDAATNIFYMGHGQNEAIQKASSGMVFELNKRKYKGNAPDQYRLLRNPDTLTHSLLGEPPVSEIQRQAAERKMARLGAYNRDLDQRTCAKLVAAVDGVPVETIHRHLGWV